MSYVWNNKTIFTKTDINYHEIAANVEGSVRGIICGCCMYCEISNNGYFNHKNPEHMCRVLGGVYIGTTGICDLFNHRENLTYIGSPCNLLKK